MENKRSTDDDAGEATPQLEPDVDDPGGELPAGEAQDRRGPEPPKEELLPE